MKAICSGLGGRSPSACVDRGREAEREDHRAEQQHRLQAAALGGLDARQRRSSSTTVADDRDRREQHLDDRRRRPRSSASSATSTRVAAGQSVAVHG